MTAQALSGIAKDLTKMSAKSAVKLVVPEDSESSLYRWVAILTGSKNALKGGRTSVFVQDGYAIRRDAPRPGLGVARWRRSR